MKKPWSISTTVRNPERLRNFLSVLKKMEGENFTSESQIKYQILLIQEKLYKPVNLPGEYLELFENPSAVIDYETAEKIFNYKKYEDPPMRGRQSVNPLNKLGFCIAREGLNKIVITELGNRFLQGDYDIGFIFFKSLLKMQFPNPWSGDFKEEEGFDIMPLIAVMKLIKLINEKSGKKGLDSREFKIFVPTLINANEIEAYADEVIRFRNEKNKDKKILSFVKNFYGTKKLKAKKVNNLFDYGDNIMRYFRLTKYFRVETDPTGSHWNINLEPSREEEINQLLEMYDGHALKFNDIDEYLQYLSDIEKPELPWEKEENLKKIAFALKDSIIKYASEKNIKLKSAFNIDINIDGLNKAELNNFIMALRTFNLSIREVARKIELMSDFSKLAEIIKTFRNVKLLRKFEPEQFEKLVVDALKILNDEILIKPNYPVDDNGEPINHASPNKPDIECYYEKHKAICEVTLRADKLQWIQETNPVMRHLRDFENQNKESNVLCLFIAPIIHKDTLSIFWYSIKSGYDGPPQKIIPFTTEQFATLLEIFYNLVKKGKRLRHNELYDFYLSLLDETRKIDSFTDWVNKRIPLKLNEWKREATAQ